MEYIGDRSVAMAISKNLEEVEKEIKINERIIKDNGYLIKDTDISFRDEQFKISFENDEIHVVVKRKKSDGYRYFINSIPSIDFVAIKRDEKIYIQVSDNISNSDTFKREITPLLQIKDAYPKMVIASTRHEQYDYEGVSIIDIADWLTK